MHLSPHFLCALLRWGLVPFSMLWSKVSLVLFYLIALYFLDHIWHILLTYSFLRCLEDSWAGNAGLNSSQNNLYHYIYATYWTNSIMTSVGKFLIKLFRGIWIYLPISLYIETTIYYIVLLNLYPNSKPQKDKLLFTKLIKVCFAV